MRPADTLIAGDWQQKRYQNVICAILEQSKSTTAEFVDVNVDYTLLPQGS